MRIAVVFAISSLFLIFLSAPSFAEKEPFTLSVNPDPLIAGQTATFIVTDGQPNKNTWLAYSRTGPGSFWVPILNVTVDLANPIKAFGPTRTDESGTVSWTAPIPSGAAGLNVWIQSVQYGQTTNVVTTSIEPSPTPGMAFVPAGDYEMGDHLGTGYYQELPVHAVHIDAFYMDTFEVTNKDYCTYLNSAYSQGLLEVIGGVVYKNSDTEVYCSTTSAPVGVPFFGEWSRITWNGSTFGFTAGKGEHPMVQVNWYGAAAYANWRSVQEGLTPCYNLSTWECTFGADGYRLPTEAEWEKASRGGEHSPYYDYPWGTSIDGSKANYLSSGDPYETGDYPHTTPVGYYDGNQVPSGVDMANGYGLYDLAGSVYEWCNDWYDDSYYQDCVDYGIYDNPPGPPFSPYGYRVFRGGSWWSYEINLRCAGRNRNYPDILLHFIGFRLARTDL